MAAFSCTHSLFHFDTGVCVLDPEMWTITAHQMYERQPKVVQTVYTMFHSASLSTLGMNVSYTACDMYP